MVEVEKLSADYPIWKGPAFTTTGVKEIRAYLEDQISQEECLQLWSRREFQYAKRQYTWWKKYGQVTWFEIGEEDWRESLLKHIS